MNPVIAVTYSFLFGLLHGILPDEHTWPITFSYAIGSGSGKEGMKAGLYFSLAFTVQRTIISELAYLALAPFIFTINKYIYLIVGLVMFIAGVIVLKKNVYPHLHFLGHHHDDVAHMEKNLHVLSPKCNNCDPEVATPPIKWTLIHGFIAGFGFGGFALFVNTIAAPAMPNALLGFLPGLFFGVGTMLMLVIVGALFGMSLKWLHALTESDIKKIGADTGGKTLFFGGILFMIAGILTLLGIDIKLPLISDYTLITIFMLVVAIPAFIHSYRQVRKVKKNG
ncbi:MAG: hypothetical protein ACP5OF_04470 [bacterium]